MEVPGRSCPLAYRYQPEALAQPAKLEADTLYVVGGLYGNPVALPALLERADREPSGPATSCSTATSTGWTSIPRISRRSAKRSWPTMPSRATSRPNAHGGHRVRLRLSRLHQRRRRGALQPDHDPAARHRRPDP